MENDNRINTRRETQINSDLQQNSQIDKTKLGEKKEILKPPTEVLSAINTLDVAQNSNKDSNFIRNNDSELLPSPLEYEIDEKDLKFLTETFQKEIKSLKPFDLVKNNFVKDFQTAIVHIEKTRDFINKPKFKTDKFHLHWDKITDYWKKKSSDLCRPLLRNFWRDNIKKKEFGEINFGRNAFQKREIKERRTRRPKLTDEEALDRLQTMESEFKIALQIVRLIILREKLSLENIKSYKEEKEHFSEIGVLINDCKKEIEEAHKLRAPEVIQEIAPEIPVVLKLENEVPFVISSLINEIKQLDFSIQEFGSGKIDQINQKLRIMKQKSVKENVMTDFPIFFDYKKKFPQNLEVNKIHLFRRIGINSEEIYIDKFYDKEYNDFFGKNENNFVSENLIKRDFDMWRYNYGSVQMNSNEILPGVLSITNTHRSSLTDIIKKKLFLVDRSYDFDNCEQSTTSNDLYQDQSTALDMKLDFGFKQFLKKRKV